MKKIFFVLVALVCSMNMNAQIMKIMKDGKLVATYKASQANQVVFEDVPIKGSAKATIGGKEVNVKWVQLWENGPKFAEYNVGVTDGKAESHGGYYQWGGKVDNDPKSGQYNTGTSPLSGNDDTATAIWGDNWRMPSKAELESLVNNCTVENITQNGVNGTKFTGKGEYSDNSIFLPKAGYSRGKILDYEIIGYYWSKTPNDAENAWYVRLYNTPHIYSDTRNKEYTVRAVLNDPYNGYEYVDLGLPSGLKWATCNVGANSPEEYGDYFAWGATKPQEVYDWAHTPYQTQNTTSEYELKFTKYEGSTTSNHRDPSATDEDVLKTVLDPEDDAAHVNWGGDWRMPTKEEQEELIEKCRWTWGSLNGVNGYTVLGPNGNSIFLPASGYRHDDKLEYEGKHGFCYSSSLLLVNSRNSWYLAFGSSEVNGLSHKRCNGYPVRPVCP